MLADKVKVICINCGATNNYPMDKLEKRVVCGRCKNVLSKPGQVLEPSPVQLYTIFQKSHFPILVDFYSPTCAPCHLMHPIVDGLARRRQGELIVVKINVDQNPELAAQFGIQAVPTFVILYKGNERARTSGAMAETDFSLWVASIA